MDNDIKKQAISGVRWTTVSTIFTTVIQFVQLAILARLLTPRDFGLMAMIMIVIELSSVFSEMGLSTAIIQRSNPKRTELSTLYWLNIATGFIAFFFILVCTPIFVKYFQSPEIKELLPVVALTFTISPFGSQFMCLMQKSLQFNLITRIELGISFLKFAVTVFCAFSGLGVWSLVFGQLAGTIVQTILLVCYGWMGANRPLFHFNWSDTKGYLGFGLYRVGAMAANHLNSRIDQLVIGIVLGPVQLGYYNMAFRLALQPIQKINPIVTRVAFPVFSIVQDDISRLKKGYLKMVKLLMSVNAPVLIGLAVTAPVVVPFFVGEQWHPCIHLVQILAFYALIRSLGNAGGSLICARGHANWTFYWNLVLLIFIPATVYLAGQSGSAVYVAGSLVGLQFILFFAHYHYFLKRILGHCLGEYIRSIGVPFSSAFLMGFIILLLSPFVSSWSFDIKLLLEFSIGALIYIMLSWYINNEIFIEFIRLVPIDDFKRFKRSPD